MRTLSKRSEQAADKFLAAMAQQGPQPGPSDKTQEYITALVRCAFYLYEHAWGPGFDVGQWQWPYAVMGEWGRAQEDAAENHTPWAVLLRHALRLAGWRLKPPTPAREEDADTADFRATLEAASEDELDERVHEAKAAEAAALNNEGRAAQIAYLLGEDTDDDTTTAPTGQRS